MNYMIDHVIDHVVFLVIISCNHVIHVFFLWLFGIFSFFFFFRQDRLSAVHDSMYNEYELNLKKHDYMNYMMTRANN